MQLATNAEALKSLHVSAWHHAWPTWSPLEARGVCAHLRGHASSLSWRPAVIYLYDATCSCRSDEGLKRKAATLEAAVQAAIAQAFSENSEPMLSAAMLTVLPSSYLAGCLLSVSHRLRML